METQADKRRKARERYWRNREARLETMRRYDALNRDAHRARDKKRHYTTKAERNAESRAYRAANLARLQAYDRARYANDTEGRKAVVRATTAKYPARVAANHAARRARLNAAAVPLTADDRKYVIALYAKARALTELSGLSYHVDHIKPLSKGGLHHPSNLQVLRGADNIKKGAKWP